MRKGFIICLLICFVVSCTNKSKIPSGIIPPEKMENVMWDMIQADRFSSQFLKDTVEESKAYKTFELYEQVFKVHNISREEFISSFKYYLNRPDITKIMFDSISAQANRRKADVYKIKVD